MPRWDLSSRAGRWVVMMPALLGLFVLAALTAYLPILGVVLAAPLAYVLLFYRFPFLFALAFVFTLGFGAFLNLPVTSGGFPISTAILTTSFLLGGTAALIRKDRDFIWVFFRRPEHLLVSGFLGVMIVSLINSRAIAASVRQMQLFVYCWLIFFFVQMILKKREELERVISWTVFAGMAVGLIGLLEIAMGQPLYWALGNRSLFAADVSEVALNAHAGRINGLIGDAPYHGIYMVIIVCLSLYKILTARSQKGRIGYGAILFLAVVNVLLSASRGAVIALGIAVMIVWIFFEIRRKWLILGGAAAALGLLLLIVVIAMPDMRLDRLLTSKGEASQTAEMRFSHIPIALDMFFDHPLIGTGPDGFAANYSRYAPSFASDAHAARVMKAHNTPLQLLAEYGVVGSAVLAFLYFLTLGRLWRIAGSVQDPSFKLLSLALFGVLAGYLFFMITSNVLMDKNLWLVIALAQGVITLSERPFPKGRGVSATAAA